MRYTLKWSGARISDCRQGCVVVAIVAGLGVCGVPPVSAEEGTGNMVFFKGGFMNLNQDRAGQTFADTGGASGVNGGNAGWYAGAGLDLVMSKNAWGAMDKTWVVGEIGLHSTVSTQLL